MAVHHHGLSQSEELQLVGTNMNRCDPWEINRMMSDGQTIQQYATSLVGEAMGNPRLKMGTRLKAVALTIRMGQQNLLRQKIANDTIGGEVGMDREVLIVLPSNGSERTIGSVDVLEIESEPQPVVCDHDGDCVIDVVAEPADIMPAGISSTLQTDSGVTWCRSMQCESSE